MNINTNPQKELLTPEEAADLLSLNIETVRRMLREERLPGVKIGDNWRIQRSAIDELFSKGS